MAAKRKRPIEILTPEEVEALRDMVVLATFVEEVRDGGGYILVERDGKIREIVQL